jgi:hypothetical protein
MQIDTKLQNEIKGGIPRQSRHYKNYELPPLLYYFLTLASQIELFCLKYPNPTLQACCVP